MTTVSDRPHAPRSILMVCMGNICRSPTAEGVLRAKLLAAGLGHVLVDSAGTHDYHVGEPPDGRSQRHAAQRGYDLSPLRARQVSAQDFSRFDLILVMDDHNIDALEAFCPPGHSHKVKLLMEFAPDAGFEHVPDPYYGSPQDFELVLDLVEQSCAGILLHLAPR